MEDEGWIYKHAISIIHQEESCGLTVSEWVLGSKSPKILLYVHASIGLKRMGAEVNLQLHCSRSTSALLLK